MPIDPQVVLGAVDDHDVDAVSDHALGHCVAGKAGIDNIGAVLVAHVVVGPIDVRR